MWLRVGAKIQQSWAIQYAAGAMEFILVEDQGALGGGGGLAGFRRVFIVHDEDAELARAAQVVAVAPAPPAPVVQQPTLYLDLTTDTEDEAQDVGQSESPQQHQGAPASPRGGPQRATARAGHVYLIGCDGHTYIGWSYDVRKRLRAHNGEICGGARATSWAHKRGRTWSLICDVRVSDKKAATKLERAWKMKRDQLSVMSTAVPIDERSAWRSAKALHKVLRVAACGSAYDPVVTWHDDKFAPLFIDLTC